MEITDKLKDYSYRKIFYCTDHLSVTSLSYTSEEGKNLLNYVSQEKSLKFHFFYVIFLFRNKMLFEQF